jgi:microcystin-dependent protein
MGFGGSQAQLESSFEAKFVKKEDLKEFAKLTDIKESKIDDTQFVKQNDISNLAKIDDLSKFFVKTDFQTESDNYINKQEVGGKLDTKNTELTYVKTNELNNYVKTSALTGLAKTEDLAPYVTTNAMNTELNNYVKTSALTGDLAKYVSKAEFENEMGTFIDTQQIDGKLDNKLKNLTYIKSGDIPARFNTLIGEQLVNGPLDRKITDLRYIKDTDIAGKVRDELTAATFNTTEVVQSFVDAFNANEEIRTKLADSIGKAPDTQKNLQQGLTTSALFQTAVSQNLTTSPTMLGAVTRNLISSTQFAGTVVTGINNSTAIKSEITNSIAGNDQFREGIVQIMGSEQNLAKFKGPEGSISDENIQRSVAPKVMWCADGDMCGIPANKKGFQLSNTQSISGLKVPVNQNVDFGFGLEREPGATDVRKIGNDDATMKAVFDTSTATALQNAQNSALEIYGLGRLFVEGTANKRHPRQIKMYDNVHVDNNFNVKGTATFNENVTIAKGKAFTADGAMSVGGATTFNENVTIAKGKAFTAGGAVTVTGPSNFLENINILAGKVLQVGGTTSTGTLVVTGAATTGNLNVNGKMSVNNTEIVPIGTIVPFAGKTTPSGWLLCDGSSKSKADFPVLATLLGNTYGPATTTNFTLPDLRGRTVIGSGTGKGLTARTLGGVVGSETHTLTTAQMPSHTHEASGTTSTNGAHTHGVELDTSGGWNGGRPQGSDRPHNATHYTQSAGDHSHTFSITTGSAGDGKAHPNMQPSIVLNYIIRAK